MKLKSPGKTVEAVMVPVYWLVASANKLLKRAGSDALMFSFAAFSVPAVRKMRQELRNDHFAKVDEDLCLIWHLSFESSIDCLAAETWFPEFAAFPKYVRSNITAHYPYSHSMAYPDPGYVLLFRLVDVAVDMAVIDPQTGESHGQESR